MKRTTLILGFLLMCGAAYMVSKVFTPTPTVKPVVHVPVIAQHDEPAAPVVRARPVPVKAPVAKDTEAKAALDKRFTELRDEGRMIRDQLMKSEPKAAQAYQSLGQNPDYQALVSRRRLLEGNWAGATDAERQSIVNEINAIRQQTVGMVLTEIARLNSQPAQPQTFQTGLIREGGQKGQQPAAPAAQPPPPIIYM
jgi:hypothetical protein